MFNDELAYVLLRISEKRDNNISKHDLAKILVELNSDFKNNLFEQLISIYQIGRLLTRTEPYHLIEENKKSVEKIASEVKEDFTKTADEIIDAYYFDDKAVASKYRFSNKDF